MNFKNIFKKKKPIKQNETNEKAVLVVVMGGVCSGKTTHRKEKYVDGYHHIDAGEIFIELSKGEYYDFPSHLEKEMNDIGLQRMANAIVNKKNIVLELIGAEEQVINILMQEAKKINYEAKIDFMQCDPNIAWQRNLDRGNDNISAHFCEPYHIRWFIAITKNLNHATT